MPTNVKPTTEVTCPKCGEHFELEASIVDHLRDEWVSQERAQLKRELLAEQKPEIEKRAQKQADILAAKKVREAEEELSERNRQIASLRRQVTTLQKKPPPGRAQELGVVRQQTLADILKARFRTDRVSVISRGIAGADVVQIVCDGGGAPCGSILWETKRAANRQKSWVQKLRGDQKAGKHTAAVIVSDVLPDPDRLLMEVDGVWVATIDVAGDVAMILRQTVLDVAAGHGSAARRDDLKGLVYDFLTSAEFTGRIAAIVETALHMRDDVDQERRVFQARWKQREQQIESVVHDTATIYGNLKGIGARLPTVEALELGAPDAFELPTATESRHPSPSAA